MDDRVVISRPRAPAGKVLVEGVGCFDGDDKVALKKAFFKQKVIKLVGICIIGMMSLIWVLIIICIIKY